MMFDAVAQKILREPPGRASDAAIWLACFEPTCSHPDVEFHTEYYDNLMSREAIECDLGTMWVDQMDPPLLSYTKSIDAALSLIERIAGPGVEWDATTLYGIARVSVGLNLSAGDETAEDKGGSVPIALCLAAIKIAQRDGLQKETR